ncbi:hypothetical protein Nepgr_032492 [Nepenthes gracilis]|uniref:RING-type domain-containing protein n=1 Tax=Nepenthes gracilis TaxID=150966 RepID=A0AAD3TK65_NEPGR|nr:hypothetical protein Nepgr_032492 [Nepenthes gracilis]
MNGNQQMQLQYINPGGHPYTVGESFMDFFQSNSHFPEQCVYPISQHDQESAYWSVNMNSYGYELSGLGSNFNYGSLEGNGNLQTNEVNGRAWEYASEMHIEEEPTCLDMQYEENAVSDLQDSTNEEYVVNHGTTIDPEVVWQGNIDPDNMTYEELLDLSEAVGTQNRGLSQELIKLLPTSRYKARGFFSRGKIKERCVICQLTYKIGDQQMTLPCKHVYHKKCCTKWLSINKTCPVCNGEVFSSEPES